MRRPQVVRRVTGTDSHAFFVLNNRLIRGVYDGTNNYNMKKVLFLFSGLAVLLGLVGCGGDDHKEDEPPVEEPTVLTVNLSEVVLSAEAKSSQDLTITSNSVWTISNVPDWLDVSATSGSSTSTIKLMANSANNSAEERSAVLTVASDDKSCQVTIKQKPLLSANCKVVPNRVAILSDGIAFDLNYDENVSYFYVMALEKDEIRNTDAEIIEYLKEEDDRGTPTDNYVISWSGMSPKTEYVIYTVAYDENGNQGELSKTTITTKSDVNQAQAYISDMSYSYYYWKFTTTIGAYCKSHYMLAFSGSTYGEVYLYSSDAYLAWLILDINASNSPLTPIVQSQDWRMSREAGENYFHVFTWGVDASGEYAGVVNRGGGYASSASTTSVRDVEYTTNKTPDTMTRRDYSLLDYENTLKDVVRL